MRRIMAIITMLAALLLATTGWAASPSVVDGAKLLDPQAKAEVTQVLKDVEQKLDIRLAVITTNNIGQMTTQQYANGLLDKYYTEGAKGNMLLLHVPSKRAWFVTTDIKLKPGVGKAETKLFEEALVPYLKKGDNAGAYKEFAKQTELIVGYYLKEGERYDPNAGVTVMAVLAGLLVGGIGAYLIRQSLIDSMSNVTLAAEADAYLDKDSFVISAQDDIFLYQTVHVEDISKNDKDDDNDSNDSSHGGGGGTY